MKILKQARNDLAAHQLNCANCSYPVVHKKHLEMAHLSVAVLASECFSLLLSRQSSHAGGTR